MKSSEGTSFGRFKFCREGETILVWEYDSSRRKMKKNAILRVI